jgi:hypothetical protein
MKMGDLIISVGYLMAVLAFLGIGLCLLISPRTFFDLRNRLRIERFRSKTTEGWDSHSGQWRVVGLAFTLVSLYMLIGPFVRGRASLGRSAVMPASLGASRSSTSWGSYAFLIGFLTLGFALAIWPNRTVSWLIPSAKWGDDPQSRARVIRVSGILIIIFSVFCMFLSIRN